ncbi:hypothetical protein Zmor_021361 [Zophobas morio]|uniref:Amine oxidase domain-containing protein n=1 Tax=Zophobas morio TaxID=2755281 RepID=A0AA38I5X6_9CUCU|nr:hypothetical protein Zmor_021361 [Zophobas morio]
MKNPSVIIIGAGVAGIAAGTKLLENSIENVLILEAEDRIGGRIHSMEFGDSFVELGAEYCHGEKNNITYELAKDLDVLEPGVEPMDEHIYYSNGSKLDCEFIQELRTLILDYQINEIDNNNTKGNSIGKCFMQRYNSTVLKKYGSNEEYEQILKEGVRFAEGYILMVEGTFSWEDSSAESSYIVCEGDQSLVWKKPGYKTLLDILIGSYPDSNKRKLPHNKIRLNTKVEKICWDQKNNTVRVITSDKICHSADYVIFTPSLGVLKQNKDTLFHPPLPLSKQEALEATDMGGVMKVVIRFPEKWWKSEDRAFSFFWSDEDLNRIDFTEGPKSNGVSWVAQFRDISQVLHNANVWIGWFGGDLIPEIEKLSNDVLKRGCQYVLDKFLSRDYDVGNIDTIIATKWCTSPNFEGAYSYVKNGKYKENLTYQEELGQPLRNDDGKPMVLFAGEATSSTHYATVHGAIETGFREAKRILEFQGRSS